MKRQNVFRLASLCVLMFTMCGQTFAWSWLQSLYNQGRTGDRCYSELTAKAIGEGKVYVHWPIGNEQEPTADEIAAVGGEVSSEESPKDNTANAGVHGWGESDEYADHYYLLYAEPMGDFEIDGIYSDEDCTAAYNVSSSDIYQGNGYKAYRITLRTYAKNEANRESLTLYARFVLNVKINARGYSTLYYSKYNFKVPSGVTATTYKLGNGSGKLDVSTTYNAGDIIPAGEAVVLQGTANTTYKFVPVTGDYTNLKDGDNILKGTDEEEFTTGGQEYFALSYNSTKGVVGFYWMNSDGSAFKNGAHKAYLALSEASGVKGFDLEGDDATGIESLDADINGNEAIYNLAGQRVGKMQKGINIVNGKKILVK